MKNKRFFVLAGLLFLLAIGVFIYYFVVYDNTPNDYETIFNSLLEDSRLSSSEKWLATAVNQNALGGEPNVDMLANYYQTADNLNLLRLFDTRFAEQLNTDDELNIATHTAQSIARHIIDTKGADALFNPLSDIDRNVWLQSIGVEREYADPYGGYLDRYSVTDFNPLKITSNEAFYTIEPFSFDRVPAFEFDTAERIELFLYREAFGKEYIMNWLRENSAEGFSVVIPPVVQLQYRTDKDALTSKVGKRTITLNRTADHLHEYVHTILPLTLGVLAWNNEGFAEYLAEFITPFSYKKEFYEILYKEYSLGDIFFFEEQSKAADALIRERYIRYTGNNDIVPLDMRSLYDAVSSVMTSDVGDFLREDCILLLKPIIQILNLQRPEAIADPGNKLSYLEAASFIAYLCDTYSLETTIQIARKENPDMLAVFGKDYNTLLGDWIEFLNR
ncbi:MAG: hypothetical protein FWG36_09910 [Oscillospiraceae bacterium]|nr:hypothetical protein [Oscillospiraceae bacterium]